eukprot:COSAG02_NODE_234_length_27784_cov_12.556872_5_plen_100_part_00
MPTLQWTRRIVATQLADGSVDITAADPSNNSNNKGLSCALCCPRARAGRIGVQATCGRLKHLPTRWDVGRGASMFAFRAIARAVPSPPKVENGDNSATR